MVCPLCLGAVQVHLRHPGGVRGVRRLSLLRARALGQAEEEVPQGQGLQETSQRI